MFEQLNHENNQEHISEDLERKINLLKDIKCGIDPRVNMVLVLLGLKPATTLDLFTWNEDVDSVKSKITEAGLFYDEIQSPPFTNKKRTATLAIGSTKDLATKTAIGFRDPNKYHKELGEYMGYPKTAIDAFLGITKRYDEEIGDQDEIFKSKEIPMSKVGFALSKENYEEEIKVAEEWMKAIKEFTPDLYEEILSNSEKEE
jgi:hypothetical protein